MLLCYFGDQLYTLDELRCWKVENLGVLDDERSNEIGNEGGASGLVLCGMQVEHSRLSNIVAHQECRVDHQDPFVDA
jgi:hypothetical protein